MKLKRMGVMNITPNSFSDGGEALTPQNFLFKLKSFGEIDALDIGAESTAPMNESISWKEEWERWRIVLPSLKMLNCTISADTYHPETIHELVRFWKENKIRVPLIWNDVSGKFDEAVSDFLKAGENFQYVLCHNRAPKRALSGRHMEYVKESSDLFEELRDFLSPYKHQQVIFDPCLGFSKTYEENWIILDHFSKLQREVGHDQWLLGFSRKSFLRKKLGIDMNKEKLDQFHLEILSSLAKDASGEVWIRTHRPELIK